MTSVSGPRFYNIEKGTFVASSKKVALSKVVSAALQALKSEEHQLSYLEISRLYSDYKKSLQKRPFSTFYLWWNKSKLQVLRNTRDELFEKLLTNPTDGDLLKLLQMTPPTILSEDAKQKLAEFVASLPAEKKAEYVQQFIQGNLQTVLEDVSRRSDFIDRCPEIIEKGVMAFNLNAQSPQTSFGKTLINTLRYESDVKTIAAFFEKHSKEISLLRAHSATHTGSQQQEYILLRMLEAKFSLLLKKVDTLKEVPGLPFFRILRQGGTFKIGDIEYTVSARGIESKHPLDPYERLVLVKALVESGDLQYLESVFSPSLILQRGKLDEKSVAILHDLMTFSDPSIVLRTAYVLTQANEPFVLDTSTIAKYDEGILPLDRREILTFFKDATIPIKEVTEKGAVERPLLNKSSQQNSLDTEAVKPFEDLFSQLSTSTELKGQVQDAFEEFLKIAKLEKPQIQRGELSEDFQDLLKDISKLDELIEKYTQAERAAELKLYSSLPPFSPPLNHIILLYAQDALPENYPKEAISDLLTVRQNLQKCRRIEEAEGEKEKIDRIQETCSYENPMDYPFLQVFEYFMNIYSRPQQVENIAQLGELDKNKAVQLLMGSGKTFLLLPILALMRADGKNISSVMVPEELFAEVSKQLHTTLGISFQRLVTTIPVLSGDPTQLELEHLLHTLEDIKANRGVLLLTPERKHALLNALTILLNKEAEDGKLLVLLKVLHVLNASENVIGDEIDQLLRSNLQYIVTVGKPKIFEEPQRNIISELILHVNEHADDFEVSFDFVPQTEKSLKKERVSLGSYETKVKPLLFTKALELLKQEKGWNELIQNKRESIELILTMKSKEEGDQKAKEAELFYQGLTEEQKKMLFDLRAALVDVFPKTFFSNCNEEYGVTPTQENFLAVPFKGTGDPAKTKFSHPVEQVARTVQALVKLGIPEEAFKKTKEIDTKENIQNTPELFRAFLRKHVLPQVAIHPERATSDGQKLVSSAHYFSGISGTFWNATTFPRFDELIPDAQAEVQSILKLNEKANRGEVTFFDAKSKLKNEVLAELITNEKTKPLALIDSAGWLRDIDLQKFIRDVLASRPDLKVVIYHDEKGNLIADDGKGKIVPYNKDFDEVVPPHERFTVYLKQYTTGVDIPQSDEACAVLTLGKQMILRDAQQSTFRMRKIMDKQKLQIAYDDEAANQIEQLITWKKTASLDFPTYIKFLITSQVTKLLPDNYQSVRQRMRDTLEAKVRGRMCELAVKGDENINEIRELFTAAREFFIETEKEEASKEWSFPIEVDKEKKVAEDIKSFKAKFQKVNEILKIEDIDGLLEQCYNIDLLDDKLESGDSSRVGQEILIQNQVEFQKAIQIQVEKESAVLKLNLEQLSKSIETEYSKCTHSQAMDEAIDR